MWEWKHSRETRCDILGSLPSLLRPHPTTCNSTYIFLINRLPLIGFGVFLKMPSRYLTIILVMAAEGSGKGPLCSPASGHLASPICACLGPGLHSCAGAWCTQGYRAWEGLLPGVLVSPSPIWLVPAQTLLPTSSCGGSQWVPGSLTLCTSPPRMAEIPAESQQPSAGPQMARALVTPGSSPPCLPSFPGTLLPNILCGNYACWPYFVLLATAKFPLLVPDRLPPPDPSRNKSCFQFSRSGQIPSLRGSSVLQRDGHAFSRLRDGRKAGLEKGRSGKGGLCPRGGPGWSGWPLWQCPCLR